MQQPITKQQIEELQQQNNTVKLIDIGHERSQNAAETIASMGFANVFYLRDGTAGWLAE